MLPRSCLFPLHPCLGADHAYAAAAEHNSLDAVCRDDPSRQLQQLRQWLLQFSLIALWGCADVPVG